MKKYLSIFMVVITILISSIITYKAIAAPDSNSASITSTSINFLSVSVGGIVHSKTSLNPGSDFVSINWGDGSATTTGVAITVTNPPKDGTWATTTHTYSNANTYTITAFFLGASGTVSATTISDTVPPVIDNHADVLGVEATSSSGATVTFTVNSTDNVDGVLPAICSPASGSTFTLGTTKVECNKTDSSGNVATTTDFFVEVVDTTPPDITVPAGTYVIPVFSTFTDPGATANDLVDGTVTVNSSDDVNTSVLGSYTITYSAIDSHGNGATNTRTVTVVDEEDPIITLLGSSPVYVEVNTTYEDAGFTTTDNVDGDLTASTTIVGLPINLSALGTTTITYNVTDSSGNSAVEQTREVVVRDTTSPVITVLGDNPTSLKVSDSYTEAGATASDNYDGDLTSSIIRSGTVDTATAGIYTVTYSVTDSSGNSSTSTRTINIRNIGTDASLSELSVSMGVLNPVFSSGTLDYTVDLPYGTTETPTVSATANDQFAWSIGIVPAANVNSTTTLDRTTTVTVTAEDNVTTRTYSIIFSVAAEPIPEIMNETVVDKTTSSVTVSWLTDHPATSRVIYDTVSHTALGSAPNYGYANSTTEDSTLVTNHSVTVTSLNPGTTYYIRTVSHGSPEVVSDEVVAKTDSRSSGGSSGGSSGSHTVTTTVVDNSAAETANFLHFLNLLSAIGNNNQTETSSNLAILPPALTAKAIVIPEQVISTTTTEEFITPAPMENNNIPLSAAAATSGMSINWWWVLVMLIIVGTLIYFYNRGRKDI